MGASSRNVLHSAGAAYYDLGRQSSALLPQAEFQTSSSWPPQERAGPTEYDEYPVVSDFRAHLNARSGIS
jgi:hypothetical protein